MTHNPSCPKKSNSFTHKVTYKCRIFYLGLAVGMHLYISGIRKLGHNMAGITATDADCWCRDNLLLNMFVNKKTAMFPSFIQHPATTCTVQLFQHLSALLFRVLRVENIHHFLQHRPKYTPIQPHILRSRAAFPAIDLSYSGPDLKTPSHSPPNLVETEVHLICSPNFWAVKSVIAVSRKLSVLSG